MIPLTRPWFDEAEHEAVRRVLDSGMLVQGAEVERFERGVAERLRALGAQGDLHAIAVSSGTTALDLALATVPSPDRSLRRAADDEVIVPAVTWPSPGNAVVLSGATPVLVDVDPVTWCLSPAAVARALTPHTRAIIAIDQFGVPSDVPSLRALAADVDLIEDAACALGSTLGGVPCGLLGDVATFSFHPRKVLTTGEGGLLVTRSGERAEALRALRNHGQVARGVFHGAGYNARLGELAAALGSAQLTKLDAMLSRRRALAEEVRAAVGLSWQGAPEGATVNHQTLGLVLPTPEGGGSRREARDALVAALRADGIEAGALSYALHRLPQFARHAVNATRRFPVTDAVVDGGLAVPLHPGMTSSDAAAVIDGLRRHAAWALGRSAFE